MAVQAFTPLNQAEGFRRRPIDDHGKIRIQYAKTVTAVVGDTLSTYSCGALPPGTTRVLPWLSRLTSSAGGAGLVLSVGHGAYRTKSDVAINDGIIAADYAAFASAMSVAAAGVATPFTPALLKFDISAQAAVPLIAQTTGATAPVGFTLETLIAYVYE